MMIIEIKTFYPKSNVTTHLGSIQQGEDGNVIFQFSLNTSWFKFDSIDEFEQALVNAARWKELRKNLTHTAE